jgi:hypothetical protein
MSNEIIKKVVYVVAVVLLLFASFLAGRLFNRQSKVQAQDIIGDETRYMTSFNCDINQVAIFDNRAHIRCANPENGIAYFAVANTPENQSFINRVMAIGLTNMSMNRSVWVFYETLSSSNPPGCNTGDCRKLEALSGSK